MNTDTIKIQGKNYPIKFGNGCIKRFCLNHEPPIEELNEFYSLFSKIDFKKLTLKTFDEVALLIHSAIKSGCGLSGQECTISFDELYESLGDDLDIMPNAMKIFNRSYQNQAEGEGTKKKTVQPKK